jgi:TolB-like protein/DNA-binding winged helix-turn-helix (wHTH) protein/cytochrome c-type biogenesis protein CcmH/NrfG
MTASIAESYRFDGFVVDARSACLRRDGASVPLRPKSFDVLLYLVRNRGRLVSKDELFDNVWANVVVTDNSLVQCIKEVRHALGDDGQTVIETVAKRGYVFTPAVVDVDDGDPTMTRAAAAEVAPSSGQLAPAGAPFVVRQRMVIAAVVALMVAGGLWWALSPPVMTQQPAEASNADRQAESRISIAVLPFGILGETADDYFSVGISEDIAAALARFSDLAVTSPRVVARFQSVGAGTDDIQRQLKVRYLVEGSVRRTPERIRIAVRLTDLPRGTLLWSEAYDASAPTIFAIEDDITIRIAGALAVKLTNIQQARLAGQSTGNLEAYDLVLRGRDLLTRLSRTAHSQARTMFERAIALDPQYAAAYVGLGRIDLSAVALGWTGDPETALKRAEGLARKAISLDEFNPAAQVLLGRAYSRMRDYERAVDALKRAVALNPSEPDSHAGLGDALLWNGEIEGAIKALETATAVDPRLSAEDLFSLGAAYFLGGRGADAIRIFERIVTRKEGNPFIYAMLAAVYAEGGRDGDSRSAAAEVRKLNPFFDVARFGSLFKKSEHRDRLANALKNTGL